LGVRFANHADRLHPCERLRAEKICRGNAAGLLGALTAVSRLHGLQAVRQHAINGIAIILRCEPDVIRTLAQSDPCGLDD